MRVRLEIQDKYFHRFHAMMQCAPALEAQGIKIGREVPNPDVVFLQESTIRERPDFVAPFVEAPLIIYERSGCAPVNRKDAVRRFLQRDNVLAWTKETDFADHTLNNGTMIDGRYHLKLINIGPHQQAERAPSVLLAAADLAKIRHIFPIHMQERYDYLKTLRPKTLRKRPIDVFYAGSMNYTNKLVDQHRTNLVSRLLVVPYQTLVRTGNLFEQDEFQMLLTQAKVFVSPYGSGTYSWKDFEAIFAGCVLIKPKADYIAHYGFPIFDPGRFCIQCDPNFEDLATILAQIMSDGERYAAFAADARNALFAACNLDSYAADLAPFFKGLR